MALVLADRVRDTTTTTGTGTVTLSGTAPTGYQTFGAGVGNANTTYYTINANTQWEVGIGTYTASGTTLSRNTVLASSNGGALVDFAAGTKDVFVTYPAEKAVTDAYGVAANATTAANIGGGAAGSIPYQTAANTTSLLAAGTGVLIGGTTPSYTASPSLTQVTVAADPTTALQVATKQYVDTIAATGITYHTPVKYEVPDTTGNLNATYNQPGGAGNGVGATLTNAGTLAAFAPDGPTASVSDRILVYNQTSAFQNGIYTVTTVGSGSVAWVLTRATDANTYGLKSPTALGEGDAFFVTSGDTGAGETYVMNTSGTIVFGSTAINFVQVSDATLYTAGNGLQLTSGTVFSLIAPVTTVNGGTGLTAFTSGGAVYATSTSALTTGTLPATSGGTGLSSFAAGDLLYATSSTAIGKLADIATGNALISGGVGTAPSYGKIGLTTHISGTLAVGNGGTGATSLTGYLVGNGTSAFTATATIPTSALSGTISLTTQVSGTLGAGNGGTGLSSYTVGDILYASGTTALSSLADVATGNALISGGVSVAPSWGKIGLTTHVSGTLPVANGGSGATTLTGYLKGNGTSAFTASATIPAGDITSAALTKADDTNVTLTLGGSPTTALLAATSITAGWTGQLAVSRGGTGNSTLTANGILLGNGVSPLTATAVGATGQVLVGNTGAAPTWATLSGIGVTSFSAGSTGLTPSTATTGVVTLAGTLGVANGGTGATTLSSGYLLKGNGTSAVSASVVYDTGTNVGIGTASPVSLLHVDGGVGTIARYGSSGALVLRSASGTQASPTAIASSTVLGISIGRGYDGTAYRDTGSIAYISDGAISSTSSPGYIQFNTTSSGSVTNTERMRIDSSGNVGIGTTGPSSYGKLAVIGNIASSTDGATILTMRANAGATTLGAYNTTASSLSFTTNTGGAGELERMRITDVGNVGIGTSSPGAKLHVFGNNGTFGTNSFFGLNGSTSGIAIGNNGTIGLIQGQATATSSTAADIALQANGGNVGIGTSSPKTRLQATAGGFLNAPALGSATGAPLYVTNSDTAYGLVAGINNSTGHTWLQAQRTDGSATAYNLTLNEAGGNVGIGTSSPGSKLDVSSSIQNIVISRSTGSYAAFQRIAPTGQQAYDFYTINGVEAGRITVNEANFMAFATGSSATERMRIDGSGNVGIGNAIPGAYGARLAIGDPANAYSNTLLALTQYATFSITANGTSAAAGTTFDYSWANGGQGPLKFSSSGTERMRIDANGGVGIGIVPDSRFQVDLSGIASMRIGYGGVSSNYFDANANIFRTGAAAETMRINSAGNVGIGTSSPAYKLDVTGQGRATTGWAVSTDGSAFTPSGLNAIPNYGTGYITSTAITTLAGFGGISAYTNQLERMRIDASGNVGIGTSSPGAKLDVSGNIRLSAGTPNIEFNNGGGMIYGPAGNTLAFATGGGPSAPQEKMRINSSGEFLTGTSVGGRAVCMYASDMWLRLSNASRQWIIGPSIGTSFNIWDETGGYNAFYIDTAANIYARNSMFFGAGQNNDNKIELGAGRTGNNYAYIDLIGDTTYTDYGLRLIRGNGGANTTSQLVHRGTGDMYLTTQDNAPMYFQTNSTTRIYIENSGNTVYTGMIVGRNGLGSDVNSANDTGSMSVRGSTTTAASISFHRVAAYAINMGLGTDNVFRIGGWSASSNAFQMDGSGNLTMLGNVTAYSDIRMKKDVVTIDNALDLVGKMRGVKYTRKDTGQAGVGVIAQEMLEVCPEVVQQGIGDDDTLSVAYGNLVGVLIEAVKELTARVAELEGK